MTRIVLSGNSGDSLAYHRGLPFTTRDKDNDNHGDHNCAIKYQGAWWYEHCHYSNLNGLYHRGNHSSYANGVNWKDWKGYYYSLKRTEMKIRPVDFWTVIFMAQQRYSTNLKKKHTRLNKFLVGSEVFTGFILEPLWLVSSWPSRVLSWLYKFWFFKFFTRILTWRNTERSHNLHFSRSISRINPVANSVLVPFDFAYETLKNYPIFWL